MLVLLISVLMLTTSGDRHGAVHQLFDGESLDGWKVSAENPDSFHVEDGMIVAHGPRAHLFYVGPVAGARFDDFELRMEVKTEQGSNSGVFFHTSYQDEGWPSDGIEAQVNSTHKDPRRTGSLYGLTEIWYEEGGSYPLVDATKRATRHGVPVSPTTDGQWFDYRIRVRGDVVSVFIDDEPVVTWKEPPGSDPSDRLLDGGTIALQAHDPGSTVFFRKIEVELIGDQSDEE